MKVYISGPIAGAEGLSFEEKRERFYRAAKKLGELGHDPVNPFEVNACNDMSCDPGQLSGPPPGIHTWACYLRYDLIAMLDGCTAIAMLPSWESSPGAKFELDVARRLGFQIWELDAEGNVIRL